MQLLLINKCSQISFNWDIISIKENQILLLSLAALSDIIEEIDTCSSKLLSVAYPTPVKFLHT